MPIQVPLTSDAHVGVNQYLPLSSTLFHFPHSPCEWGHSANARAGTYSIQFNSIRPTDAGKRSRTGPRSHPLGARDRPPRDVPSFNLDMPATSRPVPELQTPSHRHRHRHQHQEPEAPPSLPRRTARRVLHVAGTTRRSHRATGSHAPTATGARELPAGRKKDSLMSDVSWGPVPRLVLSLSLSLGPTEGQNQQQSGPGQALGPGANDYVLHSSIETCALYRSRRSEHFNKHIIDIHLQWRSTRWEGMVLLEWSSTIRGIVSPS